MADTETRSKTGPDGVVAVLKVQTHDDHMKNSPRRGNLWADWRGLLTRRLVEEPVKLTAGRIEGALLLL